MGLTTLPSRFPINRVVGNASYSILILWRCTKRANNDLRLLHFTVTFRRSLDTWWGISNRTQTVTALDLYHSPTNLPLCHTNPLREHKTKTSPITRLLKDFLEEKTPQRNALLIWHWDHAWPPNRKTRPRGGKKTRKLPHGNRHDKWRRLHLLAAQSS